MDIRNMIVDLWENAGEPSDLDPWIAAPVNYDPLTELEPTSDGVMYYLRQISLAQIALANWRTRRGRPIRFNKFLTQTNIKLGRNGEEFPYTATYINKFSIRLENPDAAISEEKLKDSKLIILGSYTESGEAKVTEQETMVARAVYDALNDWYTLSLRDEITNVAYNDGVDHNFTSIAATIYWNRFPVTRTPAPLMDGSEAEFDNNFRNMLKMMDMHTGSEIERAESKESLFNYQMTTGIPGKWYNLGDTIYFDSFMDETKWYTVEYQRLPNSVTTLQDTLDIPEEWHEVLLLINEWRVAKRMQDRQKADILFTELNRWIDTLRTDQEEDWLRENTRGIYVRKEAR